jgi:hypothetical protein
LAPLEALEANTAAVNYIRRLKNIEKSSGTKDNGKTSGWGKQALNLASTFHQERILKLKVYSKQFGFTSVIFT